MATTSSTWSFDPPGRVISVGVDAETVARFASMELGDGAWEWVFSAAEIDYARQAHDPAAVLCAAFCVKEGLLKAFREPYPLSDSTFLDNGSDEAQPVRVAPEWLAAHGARAALARVHRLGAELCACVTLVGENP